MRETIFDPLRKREVALTPEERVRQNMILWLQQALGYSPGRMMSEYSFKYNGLTYRADIVVFDKEGNIETLVECKAPGVKLDQTVIEQGIRYNMTLNVKCIIFTNGSTLCAYKRGGNHEQFKAVTDLVNLRKSEN